MAEVCKPLRKLTSRKMTWTWNSSYQQLFNKAKSLIKADVYMKFYDDTKLLYLETDASGISFGAALLQLHDNTTCQKSKAPDNIILCPTAFASKSLTGAEQRYSNIECEVFGILHGLEKFHHYFFSREVLIITDHKPLISMFKRVVATLSQCIQCIMLKIHQYRVQIIYKPGPKIFYCRLAIKAQSCRWQGQSNKRHGHLGGCHTEYNGHARMHINGRNTTCIITG